MPSDYAETDLLITRQLREQNRTLREENERLKQREGQIAALREALQGWLNHEPNYVDGYDIKGAALHAQTYKLFTSSASITAEHDARVRLETLLWAASHLGEGDETMWDGHTMHKVERWLRSQANLEKKQP